MTAQLKQRLMAIPGRALLLATTLLLTCTAGATEQGSDAYSKFCVACHGNQLEGGTGPSLVDAEWKYGSTKADIIRAIKVGFPNAGMPPWEGMIPEDDVSAIADYILSLQGQEAKPVEEPVRDGTIHVSERVLIDRHPISRHSTKTLNIGFPQGGNLALAPESASITGHWSGTFVDISPQLKGRGGRSVKVGKGNMLPLVGGIQRADGTPITVTYLSAATDANSCTLQFAFDGVPYQVTLQATAESYTYHLTGPAPASAMQLQLSMSSYTFLKDKGVAPPADDFSVRWTGAISVPSSGTWQIGAETDDGVRLTLDGTQHIDQWVSRPAKLDSTTVELQSGRRYPITIEYYQGGGGNRARLCWQPPGGDAFVTIPTEHLHPDAGQSANGGLTGAYYVGTKFELLFAEVIDPVIDFEWGDMNDLPDGALEASSTSANTESLPVTCTGGQLNGNLVTIPAGRPIDLRITSGGTSR